MRHLYWNNRLGPKLGHASSSKYTRNRLMFPQQLIMGKVSLYGCLVYHVNPSSGTSGLLLSKLDQPTKDFPLATTHESFY